MADGVLIGGGDHPPAAEQDHRARRGQGQQMLHELVAGAGPVDANQDLAPEPGRDLPDRRGQHLLVAGERIRARVARPQQHGQALAGAGTPGAQRVEAVALLPGGGGALLVRAGGDQGGVHVDDQPARHGLARDDQPRETRGGLLDQVPRVRAGLRAGAGDPVQHGRGPGQVKSAAHRRPARRVPEHGARCASRAMPLMLAAPSAIAAASDRHGAPVEGGRRALLPQRPAELPGQSCLVGGLPQQDRAGVADQAGPAGGDLQGTVPPVMLHGEERSSSGD